VEKVGTVALPIWFESSAGSWNKAINVSTRYKSELIVLTNILIVDYGTDFETEYRKTNPIFMIAGKIYSKLRRGLKL